MKPIVSPWFFYFANMTDNIGTLAMIVGVISGLCAAAIILGTMIGILDECFDGEEGRKTFNILKKWGIRSGMVFVIDALLMCVIPTKETIYQMEIASLVTPDNLTIAQDSAKNLIDYIVDSVNKMSEEEEQSE